jgi:hypothetical protein
MAALDAHGLWVIIFHRMCIISKGKLLGTFSFILIQI